MGLPSVTKTWNYNVNNSFKASGSRVTDYRNLWFKVKDAMVSSGFWTVTRSSNKTVADTNDNWASITSLFWRNSVNARSWIVLENAINSTQILFDLQSSSSTENAEPHFIAISISRSGFTGGGIASAPTAADTIVLQSASSVAWGNSDQNFVHHYMYTSDGYCSRHVVYVSDVPVFALFLETPKNPVPGWGISNNPSFAMHFNAAGVSNAITNSSYTSAKVQTKVGEVTNISAFLSGESFGGGGILTNTFTNPNNLDGSYPVITPGIVSTTVPYRGKMGQPFDLWFGVTNFLGAVTYPEDNTRQFAQHGSLITPWNGSIIKTR